MAAITVTAQQGGSTGASLVLRVIVVTGAAAAASQTGASTNTQFSSATTWTQSITTTGGSNVYGAAAHLNGSADTGSNATLVDSIADATNSWQYVTFKALNVSAGATARGFTTVNPSTGPFAQLEILASGTLAEDGSSPAVASGSGTSNLSVTTASFTPPAGSLLVAMVSSNGGSGVTTMTVSDSSSLSWSEKVKNNPTGGDYAGVWIAQVPAGGAPGAPPVRYPPVFQPGWLPGMPGDPFAPWPPWGPSQASTVQQDLLNAASTVTATAAATLDVVKAGVTPLPAYPPGWFPAAPSAPGGEPFTAWPLWLGATPKSDPLNAALTVTATGAAALTESKPLNAAVTVTATDAAALTESKPLNASASVTATITASLDVVKAGITPVPAYPPAWFPQAPSVPDGDPFAPWPPWTGFGGTSAPVDLLTAAAAITATGTAALTGAKPLSASATVTASRAAAETTAKPLNAASTVTATIAASLTTVAAPPGALTAPPLYVPAWFPGAPAVPAAQAFAPWPVWTGAPGVPFTIGTLTAADKGTSALTAAGTASALTALTGPAGGTLTATDQRTGGPG